MKVSGSILLDERGSFSHVHKHNIRFAVVDFVSMVKEADACKDKLYYDSEEWSEFYANGFDPTNYSWKDFGSIIFEQLFISSNPVFKPIQIGDKEEFENKPMPRTLGGFKFDGCPENYVYNKDSIETWHDNWLYNHPEKIDWDEFRHNIWPRYDRTIGIIRDELERYKEKLEKEKIEIPKTDEALVNVFHDYVMNHKSEVERISYAKEIGAKICKANYYHRETELEKLEGNHGNCHAEVIYSLKKDGKFIFLSIDKQHGMFELCDDKGNHVEEIRFNGTRNTGKDLSHSLQCVAEWKRNYKK